MLEQIESGTLDNYVSYKTSCYSGSGIINSITNFDDNCDCN